MKDRKGEKAGSPEFIPGTYPGLPRAWVCPPNIIVSLVVGVFVALIFISPYLVPADSVDLGEKGTTIPDEHGDEFDDMHPVARWTYERGDASCHQNSSRTFYLNGNQMPFCSRCVAIFTGMLAGAVLTVFRKIELKAWWVIAGFIPIAIDGTTQTLLQLRESTNVLRVLTGFPAGLVTMMALGWVMWDMYDDWRYRRLWKRKYKKHWDRWVKEQEAREAGTDGDWSVQAPQGPADDKSTVGGKNGGDRIDGGPRGGPGSGG